MLTFPLFVETATEITNRLQKEGKDAKTQFLCLLIKSVLADSSKFEFSFPKTKENFFEFGFDNRGFKKEKATAKVVRIVKELDSYTKYWLSKIDEPELMEETSVCLIEKIILLYNENMLSTKVVKSLIDSTNDVVASVHQN